MQGGRRHRLLSARVPAGGATGSARRGGAGYLSVVPVALRTVAVRPRDRGRERLSPSPPSEPGVQFSRDGLSSQLFPHRDWRTNRWGMLEVGAPASQSRIE